ncbi:MAG: VWA domain-containing protein [Candidatus Liptonbacteria bacterium]|nr:VWA domain-containing protein [Candidatus Liptonbacteria bacterium]
MRFEHPWIFCLLVAIIPLLFLALRKPRASYSAIKFLSRSGFARMYKFLERALLILALGAGLGALAKPLVLAKTRTIRVTTRDFMILADFSSSMNESFSGALSNFGDSNAVNDRKLDVMKKIATTFVKAHKSDRVGIIIFDTESYLVKTLSRSHEELLLWLSKPLNTMGGTNICPAIVTTAKHMADRGGTPGARALILFSDGEDSDLEKAEWQKKMKEALLQNGVKLYWLRVKPPKLVETMPQWEKDLKALSELSGGGTWNVTRETEVESAFKAISSLEAKPIILEVPGGKREAHGAFLMVSMFSFTALFAVKLFAELL